MELALGIGERSDHYCWEKREDMRGEELICEKKPFFIFEIFKRLIL
jgi:hypothetical protein